MLLEALLRVLAGSNVVAACPRADDAVNAVLAAAWNIDSGSLSATETGQQAAAQMCEATGLPPETAAEFKCLLRAGMAQCSPWVCGLEGIIAEQQKSRALSRVRREVKGAVWLLRLRPCRLPDH